MLMRVAWVRLMGEHAILYIGLHTLTLTLARARTSLCSGCCVFNATLEYVVRGVRPCVCDALGCTLGVAAGKVKRGARGGDVRFNCSARSPKRLDRQRVLALALGYIAGNTFFCFCVVTCGVPCTPLEPASTYTRVQVRRDVPNRKRGDKLRAADDHVQRCLRRGVRYRRHADW